MSASGMNGSLNLACLTMTERDLIEADKTACFIRWKCQDLKGAARQRLGQELLAAVPETARPAVVERLKARASRCLS